MIVFCVFLGIFALTNAGPATEASYKGQFCTDPRTMRKHPAYTEWADAYSCTRHRCQPGGRNLAIYTVGCKRVEAPESAIECEEVVEDTNMQFPYCCTRLRCLVVVRGEVWTRVLGQPWETLPAAPWSHMYKMKKPPPADGTFLPKQGEGPVYELQTESDTEQQQQQQAQQQQDKQMRAKKSSNDPDCNDVPVARATAPAAPDIVIALSTSMDKDVNKKNDAGRFPILPAIEKAVSFEQHKRGRKQSSSAHDFYEEDSAIEPRQHDTVEMDETVTEKEKLVEPLSEERYYANSYGVTQKPKIQPHHQVSWTEIPPTQWNEHEQPADPEPPAPRANEFEQRPNYHQPEFPPIEEQKAKEEKPGNLQALVDAIGTRMRDIESVVQRMTEKVAQGKPVPAEQEFASGEKTNFRTSDAVSERKHNKDHSKERVEAPRKKKPNPEGDHYKRFANRNRSSKYLHSASDLTTEQPLFVEDSNLNGYYSDASNGLRRVPPKEPAATYMAPVENRRKSTHSEESSEKKHKKRVHKKKRSKGHHKKHHAGGKDEKRKRFNRVNSVELDRNGVSLEDSSALAPKE